MPSSKNISAAYKLARARYAEFGVDTEAVIKQTLSIPISLHCWQADDVRGLEIPAGGAVDSGGIMATGSHPGRARNGDEMRSDLSQVLALLPGQHRLNLHAFYAEGAKQMDRDKLEPKHFSRWLDWAKGEKVGLDFNPTYFAHPYAKDGWTLSIGDEEIRQYWIEHGRACRRIAQHFAKELKSPCVINHWIPDGAKDAPGDRFFNREKLVDSLDRILADKSVSRKHVVDAVEGKLFGLGSEEYVVGSQEFYSNYALTRDVVLCLDLGHFHPTESVADKVSAHLQFHKQLLLHTSRPIRWDSDHVVILDDAVRNLFLEIARGDVWDRVYVALDFFDASINRLGAYLTGARATRQAILCGLLDLIRAFERQGEVLRGHERLAYMELNRSLPWGAVWDELCQRDNVPAGADWLKDVAKYEETVLSKRS